jgi:hypothetical protein
MDTQRTVVMMHAGNNVEEFVSKHRDQVQEAFGYLSQWSFSQWDKVRICLSSDVPPKTLIGTEITAVYTKSDQSGRMFQIVGVWRPEECKFTFHS